MAENKKGFILYADQIELFTQLSDEQAGKLIKHIYKYVNDEEPVCDDPLINIAFTPIKQQFKRDLKKWENTREQRSKAGKASAEARRKKSEQSATNLTHVDFVEHNPTNPTVNDTVNDTVTVKDNVKVRESILRDVIWIDSVGMKKKIPKAKCVEYLNVFLNDLELKDDLDKGEKEIKKHLVNWLNIQVAKDKP